ncbi:hypothetical protein B0H17DRAFT_1332215 [Mycena rosella]|uniref:Uncharacterized protein n=1 Tax=Mycena rosella TaxID=1033263 RepID=A0AAD7DE22_MYCRO|nr:hypothetical protein B0H17DRAFT_1332215 [Mycena rosella]
MQAHLMRNTEAYSSGTEVVGAHLYNMQGGGACKAHMGKVVAIPACRRLLNYIDAHTDAVIARLAEAVAIPSISGDPAFRPSVLGPQNVRVARRAAAGRGATTKRVDLVMDGQTLPLPNAILGRIGAYPRKKTVLLYGHFDVQPRRWATGVFPSLHYSFLSFLVLPPSRLSLPQRVRARPAAPTLSRLYAAHLLTPLNLSAVSPHFFFPTITQVLLCRMGLPSLSIHGIERGTLVFGASCRPISFPVLFPAFPYIDPHRTPSIPLPCTSPPSLSTSSALLSLCLRTFRIVAFMPFCIFCIPPVHALPYASAMPLRLSVPSPIAHSCPRPRILARSSPIF